MFINEKKNAIELSKKEAAAAAKFGTREYKALQEARKDYPGFKVVTIARKSAAKKESCKSLTYGYMEMYILEAEIMRIMQKSLKTALDLALDDILKDFK